MQVAGKRNGCTIFKGTRSSVLSTQRLRVEGSVASGACASPLFRVFDIWTGADAGRTLFGATYYNGTNLCMLFPQST